MDQDNTPGAETDHFDLMRKSVSPEIQQAIGLLFITAAAAESGLAMHVGTMMAHPNKTNAASIAIVYGMDLSAKLAAIRACARIHDTDPQAVSSLADDIQASFNERDNFIHSAVAQNTSPSV